MYTVRHQVTPASYLLCVATNELFLVNECVWTLIKTKQEREFVCPVKTMRNYCRIYFPAGPITVIVFRRVALKQLQLCWLRWVNTRLQLSGVWLTGLSPSASLTVSDHVRSYGEVLEAPRLLCLHPTWWVDCIRRHWKPVSEPLSLNTGDLHPRPSTQSQTHLCYL